MSDVVGFFDEVRHLVCLFHSNIDIIMKILGSHKENLHRRRATKLGDSDLFTSIHRVGLITCHIGRKQCDLESHPCTINILSFLSGMPVFRP